MVKNLIKNMIYYSGFNQVIRLLYGGHTSIIMLHRVCPQSREIDDPTSQMEISPEFLENFILKKKKQGWNFISLDYLYENFDKCAKYRKNIVFTLDDGFKDNYSFAYPVFKKHNVPFTIYVTNCYPNNIAKLWWYDFIDIIETNKEISFDFKGEIISIDCDNIDSAFNNLRTFYLALDQESKDIVYAELKSKYGFNDYTNLLMTWNDVKTLSKDPLCTIGAHTLTHTNLKVLRNDELYREIYFSKKELEEKINKKIEHFSFPYGGKNEASIREIECASKIGFKTCTTTRPGNIHIEHKEFLNMLPRLSISEYNSNIALNELQLDGLNSILKHKFKKVITV